MGVQKRGSPHRGDPRSHKSWWFCWKKEKYLPYGSIMCYDSIKHMAQIFPCFGWTSFIPKGQNFSARSKRKKIKKKRETGPFQFWKPRAMCNSMALVFLLSFPSKSQRKNEQKVKRKSQKKVKDIFKKAWFYGKYLVFRTFLICFSAPCSGPR